MSALATLRQVVETARSENVPFKAASIAYYAIASFVPLLAVALAALSAFGATDALLEVLRANLSGSGVEILRRVLSNTRGRTFASVAGLILALWSGIKIFRGISVAFDEIYTVGSDLSIVEQIRKSLIVLGLLFLGFVLLSAIGIALAYADFQIPYPALAGNALAVLVLALAFLPLYYVLPPVPVTVRHALPGAIVAAVGWVLLQVAFYYYSQTAGAYAAYGFLGAVLLFVTFLYFGAIVVLLGAVVNASIEPGVRGGE